MTGKSHTDPSATPFALKVMQHMNDACSEWKAEHNVDFSLYGTPLESTTYKFAKCLQKRFGLIPGVTDKTIYNSYHVHVTENIDAFEKLKFEDSVPETVSGWSHQLCGSTEYAAKPGCSTFRNAVHL